MGETTSMMCPNPRCRRTNLVTAKECVDCHTSLVEQRMAKRYIPTNDFVVSAVPLDDQYKRHEEMGVIVIDISAGGALLEFPQPKVPYIRGSRFELIFCAKLAEFGSPIEILEATARSVTEEPDKNRVRIGLQFTSFEAKSIELLTKYLVQLEEIRQPAKPDITDEDIEKLFEDENPPNPLAPMPARFDTPAAGMPKPPPQPAPPITPNRPPTVIHLSGGTGLEPRRFPTDPKPVAPPELEQTFFDEGDRPPEQTASDTGPQEVFVRGRGGSWVVAGKKIRVSRPNHAGFAVFLLAVFGVLGAIAYFSQKEAFDAELAALPEKVHDIWSMVPGRWTSSDVKEEVAALGAAPRSDNDADAPDEGAAENRLYHAIMPVVDEMVAQRVEEEMAEIRSAMPAEPVEYAEKDFLLHERLRLFDARLHALSTSLDAVRSEVSASPVAPGGEGDAPDPRVDVLAGKVEELERQLAEVRDTLQSMEGKQGNEAKVAAAPAPPEPTQKPEPEERLEVAEAEEPEKPDATPAPTPIVARAEASKKKTPKPDDPCSKRSINRCVEAYLKMSLRDPSMRIMAEDSSEVMDGLRRQHRSTCHIFARCEERPR